MDKLHNPFKQALKSGRLQIGLWHSLSSHIVAEVLADAGLEIDEGAHDLGIALHVFSSGSLRNQQDWFANARGGGLASLISGWFDLTTAGSKRESSSYQTIANAMKLFY